MIFKADYSICSNKWLQARLQGANGDPIRVTDPL